MKTVKPKVKPLGEEASGTELDPRAAGVDGSGWTARAGSIDDTRT